ncbi:MAG: hypothetical protein PHO01_07855 [Desulfotomaculaceae bacterium]|nr:hypothetical protein [Desulfotomaculaceae bacterium]
MLKNITEAMEIIKATIDELNQNDMKVIADEVKRIVNTTLNKLSNNISVKTAAEIKGGNINIIVSELKSIVKETICNPDKRTTCESFDRCRPIIICFVLRDAECVNIYNGNSETWEPGDCSETNWESIKSYIL